MHFHLPHLPHLSPLVMKWIGVGVSASVVAAAYVIANAFNPSPKISLQQIRDDGGLALILRDGRVLEYFIHGDAQGSTVLFAIHGAQTTGKLFALLNDWGKRSKVKIVSPSLPGFGLSSFLPNYTHQDWVADMKELISHLRLSKFHILGTSFGSIHAAALASMYEPRSAVQNVELYVAMAPVEANVQHDPLQGSVLDMFGKMRSTPLFKRLFEKYLVRPMLLFFVPKDGDVYRSIKHQWEGMASCADVIYQPWNFDWKSLATQGRKVVIVSGSEDNAAPKHNQVRLHNEIKGSQLIEYQGKHERGIEEPSLMEAHLDVIIKS